MKKYSIYLIATFLCLAGLVVEFRLWRADFHVPFYYETGNDVDENLRIIQQLRETGSILTNPRLGAPGIQETHDYLQGDNLELFFLVGAIAAITPDFGSTINVYTLLSILLTTWVSLYALRRLGLSDPVALVLSLLYAFQPYAIARGQRHLALSCICCVPLVFLAVVWLCEGLPVFVATDERGRLRPRLIRGRTRPALVAALLAGSSGAYYALFATGCAAVAGLIVLLRTRRPTRLVDPMILAGLICFVFALNLSPKIWHDLSHGKNQAAVVREADDSLTYGLSLSGLIRPVPYNGLKSLALAVLGRHQDTATPTEYYKDFTPDGRVQSIGLMATSGFFFLLLVLFTPRRPRGPFRLAWNLSRLNLALFLVGTIGGFGYTFAKVVTPNIRGWNRVSIFIAFLALTAVGLVLDHLQRSRVRTQRGRILFGVALAGILLLGLIDQMPQAMIPAYQEAKASFNRDRAFTRAIESALPESAMIFQLPCVEHNAWTHFNWVTYLHFKPYLHSSRLRWSAGAIKGRGVYEWQERVASEPIPQMIEDLKKASFQGIYIDRRGYLESADKPIIEELKKVLKVEPISDDRGERLFFALPAPVPSSLRP